MATANSEQRPAPAQMSQRESYHHGDLRNHLVQTVRGLVELHGAEGFSIAQAAKTAGVSSAAPYKHFRDRPEILRAVAADGMERLGRDMAEKATAYPAGSLEEISAIGLAYIEFAKAEPGVFRLMFGLTEGHDQEDSLMELGRTTYNVLIRSVAQHLNLDASDPRAEQRAYVLWVVVHGHSFLTIDQKTKASNEPIDDWALLMDTGRRLLSA